jgi:hypothetical protein
MLSLQIPRLCPSLLRYITIVWPLSRSKQHRISTNTINTCNMGSSRIVVLAQEIESNTKKLDKYLAENNLPPPSFEEDAPLMYQLPPDIAEAQEALSAALDELWWLNQGPIQTIVAKSVGLPYKSHSCFHGAEINSLLPLLVSRLF